MAGIYTGSNYIRSCLYQRYFPYEQSTFHHLQVLISHTKILFTTRVIAYISAVVNKVNYTLSFFKEISRNIIGLLNTSEDVTQIFIGEIFLYINWEVGFQHVTGNQPWEILQDGDIWLFRADRVLSLTPSQKQGKLDTRLKNFQISYHTLKCNY